MQKMVRLDRDFDSLQQGALSHADFRALWEDKLLDMEDAKMDMPTEQTLYRKYMCKLNPEIRTRVLSKDWKVDGEGYPARAPKTHQEVARAVSLLLEERADIHATGTTGYEGVMSIDNGVSASAAGLSTGGKAGKKGVLAQNNRRSAPVVPQQPTIAAVAPAGAAASGNKVRNAADPPPGRNRCKFGAKCRNVPNKGECKDWHPLEEYRELMKQFREKHPDAARARSSSRGTTAETAAGRSTSADTPRTGGAGSQGRRSRSAKGARGRGNSASRDAAAAGTRPEGPKPPEVMATADTTSPKGRKNKMGKITSAGGKANAATAAASAPAAGGTRTAAGAATATMPGGRFCAIDEEVRNVAEQIDYFDRTGSPKPWSSRTSW